MPIRGLVFRKGKSRRDGKVSRGHPCLLREIGGGGRGGGRGRGGVEPGVAARPREAGEGGADGELRRQAGHGHGVHRVVVVRVRGGRGRLQGGRGGRAEAALGGAVGQVLPVRGAQVLVSGKPLLKHTVATAFGTVHKLCPQFLPLPLVCI